MTATKPALSATYTVAEVAAALRINRDTVLRRIAKQEISPAWKIGDDWRISPRAKVRTATGFFLLSELAEP